MRWICNAMSYPCHLFQRPLVVSRPMLLGKDQPIAQTIVNDRGIQSMGFLCDPGDVSGLAGGAMFLLTPSRQGEADGTQRGIDFIGVRHLRNGPPSRTGL